MEGLVSLAYRSGPSFLSRALGVGRIDLRGLDRAGNILDHASGLYRNKLIEITPRDLRGDAAQESRR
jgi:hypothetical protein